MKRTKDYNPSPVTYEDMGKILEGVYDNIEQVSTSVMGIFVWLILLTLAVLVLFIKGSG